MSGSEKQKFPAAVRKRRAVVACTRCRRYRSRCKNDNAEPPCIQCQEAGPAVASMCNFVGRGKELAQKRKLRQRSIDEPVGDESILVLDQNIDDRDNIWDILPPSEIFEACQIFMKSCFQLGFLHKVSFLARVERDLHSVNQFLLTCVLSVSARFTPTLIQRFGDPAVASRTLVARAEEMVIKEMYNPTLETTQGLILLGTAEWADGESDKSLIHLGLASTLAGMLRLHREETYILTDAQPEDVIYSETTRRTLWVMGMQRNLLAGQYSPLPFCLSELTTLLPCEEDDFAFGIIPGIRAALPKSKAALGNPDLVDHPSRSLFATLIQAFKHWGQVARVVHLDAKQQKSDNISPWDNRSYYFQLCKELDQWENGLPEKHRWSEWNLKVYRTKDLDLAYFSIFLCTRLSSIVLRQTYLEDLKFEIDRAQSFWKKMADELFSNFISLYEGLVVFLSDRVCTEGFPPIMAFSVYVCGSLAMHLWKYPRLSPFLAGRAPDILHWCLNVLYDIRLVWLMVTRWHAALSTASETLPAPIPEELQESVDSPGMSLDLMSYLLPYTS